MFKAILNSSLAVLTIFFFNRATISLTSIIIYDLAYKPSYISFKNLKELFVIVHLITLFYTTYSSKKNIRMYNNNNVEKNLKLKLSYNINSVIL